MITVLIPKIGPPIFIMCEGEEWSLTYTTNTEIQPLQ